MHLRSILRILPIAVLVATLANCARVEPVAVKPGRLNGRAWGDPPLASQPNQVIADRESIRLAEFFSMQ